jgi:hypothetical protein
MLVCIDTESSVIMGSELLLDPPSPQDLLALLIVSMEKPLAGSDVPTLPESVHLDDSAVFDLVESDLGQLGVEVVLVKRLSAVPEFKKIIEREWFSQQVGYSGSEN